MLTAFIVRVLNLPFHYPKPDCNLSLFHFQKILFLNLKMHYSKNKRCLPNVNGRKKQKPYFSYDLLSK